MSSRGFFIALEGGEGSGKSSVARALAARAGESGREVVMTREPGGTPAAESIRELLLADAMAQADPWCEALLFAAARADLVRRVIEPALARGALVISDRFIDSSVAYQGSGRGLGVDAVRAANAFAVGSVVPDLTVVLDIDPAVGVPRAVRHNRMEASGPQFHRAVREAFLSFAEQDPRRYLVVDASRAPSAVIEHVAGALAARLQAATS